jgi:hypothetical protein
LVVLFTESLDCPIFCPYPPTPQTTVVIPLSAQVSSKLPD